MYSSYWKPNDGRESNVLTDHEALHRDEATHKAMQSDETTLRPLDLETIMSSKAAVKFWYLHRPKTMAYVHKNATKIQSLGRAFAVRRLREKHGAEYVAELARQDQARRDADALKDLSDEERAAKELNDAAYDARVEESRRLRREQIEAEHRAEEELRMKMAAEASERRRLEEERKAAALAAQEEAERLAEEERIRKEAESEEERRRQEEETARLEELRLIGEEERRAAEEAEAARKAEEERFAAEEAARLAELEAIRAEEEQERLAEEKRLREEEEERLRIEEEERLAEEERIRKEEEEAVFLAIHVREEEERIAREEEEARIREEEERRAREEGEERERKLAEAALAAKRAEEEAERLRLERIQQEKNEKYEQSLSKDVPVLVRKRGPGRVVSYDKERETYAVKMENSMGGMQITVPSDDVNLDDDRILSPRTKVDTPFGTGEVVGLDPHVGCYAINTEVNAPDDDQFLAFVQINDVTVHVEEEEERAIVEDASLPIPDEIGLVSARIVDSRIVNRTGKKFIQYKLEIRTNNYGTVFCWKRYSTFRSLCDRLMKENGMKRRDIPELPHRHVVGNFSQKTIGERAEKLNLFLNAAVRAEHLQWGIRVDDQIAVYKRRNKRVSQPSSQPGSRGSRNIFSRRRGEPACFQ
ncbi:myosin-like protein [Phytophthora infestans T30-4]|uniref:Myosin-like protein n=1 Tax=Phytophthora infestans (strain T30-4) TaxID=403677 RepID=D0NDW7_PHYIT|nr:myosin-like protein [Phytophthora infestans T30-4]EEY56412.1 myosin-like protein [Phytophthora infestans T30-4]|eukprot:XP_002902486.1 myosin-like protein [Phytophthora infestans T30-4]